MDDFVFRIAQAYDEWADIYDMNENPTRDLNAQALRTSSLPWAGSRVLEIGCGTGLNTKYLAEVASEVVGVDLSEEMLRRARKRVPSKNTQFLKDNIKDGWAFDGASFDIVVANLVLEHVENLTPVFEEAHRVLRLNGIFYIGELHPYKQLRGTQAKYEHPKTGKDVLVEAFTHPVSEYINGAINTGFTSRWIKEWKTEGDERPRLLTLLFEKQA